MTPAQTSHAEDASGGEAQSLPLVDPQVQGIISASPALGGAGFGAR